MAFHLPNGATVFVANEFADSIPINAISNASNAVLTISGGGVSEGDTVLLKSGWSALDNLVAKVIAATATSVTLGGVNTSDTRVFVGSGAGSLQVVSDDSWVQIPQITEVASSGGDQNYYQFQFLEDDTQRSLPTYKAAKTQTYTIAHDSDQPFYDVLKQADRAGDTLPMRMYVPKAKETRYWSVVPSFDGEPNPVINQIETVTASFAVQSKGTTFYKDADVTPGS
ncbi:phage tail protein [Erwinia typographi]|uniref:Phage tail protein n=1 Tax=Erwinia typographi TaxID=371042 RepID=A0A0A3YGS4_9GAMM|nr:phage tail protein [Erwinia typographi]KGT85962.1 phage tail protein [Erwinia typographi]